MLILVKNVTKNTAPNIGRRQSGHIVVNKPINNVVCVDFFVLHLQKEQFAKRRPPTNGKSPKAIQSEIVKVENALNVPKSAISIIPP